MTSPPTASGSARPMSRDAAATNVETSAGISSVRSRSGGTVSVIALSRIEQIAAELALCDGGVDVRGWSPR